MRHRPTSIMDEEKELSFKRFSSKAMLDNINGLRNMIQRIRQKEGGIGSMEDELCLYRAIQDQDLLVDIADGLKAAYDNQQGKLDTVAAAALTLQTQKKTLKETYERMVQERSDRIKELETKLGMRPKPETTSTPDDDPGSDGYPI